MDKIHISEIKQAIQNGIESLDNSVPGWEHKINLDTLDMNSSKSCIVGQLKLGCHYYDCDSKLGFGLPVYCDIYEKDKTYLYEAFPDVTYVLLTKLWREAILSKLLDKMYDSHVKVATC